MRSRKERDRRKRDADRLLQAAGIEGELRERGLQLITVTPAQVPAIFGQETVLRESCARLVRAFIEAGRDPRGLFEDLLTLRRRLGFDPPPPHDSGCRAGAHLLLSIEEGAEVLDAVTVESGDVELGLVSACPQSVDPGALARVGALLALEDRIATCKCTVQRTARLEGETCYWLLELPPEELEEARRSEHRIPLQIAARVCVSREEAAFVEDAEAQPDDADGFNPAFLVDMSLGGVKLRLNTAVGIGDQVWLAVGRLDRRSEEIELHGHVIWSSREEGSRSSVVGVEFEPPLPETRKQLVHFLARRPARPTQGPRG